MKRSATARWSGNLQEGQGELDSQSGALSALPYTFKGRFVDEAGRSGTNPEELIAAAHAGCFAMQLSGSALTLVGTVPGIEAARFDELASKAKAECPVSRALGAIAVTLDARLA